MTHPLTSFSQKMTTPFIVKYFFQNPRKCELFNFKWYIIIYGVCQPKVRQLLWDKNPPFLKNDSPLLLSKSKNAPPLLPQGKK